MEKIVHMVCSKATHVYAAEQSYISLRDLKYQCTNSEG